MSEADILISYLSNRIADLETKLNLTEIEIRNGLKEIDILSAQEFRDNIKEILTRKEDIKKELVICKDILGYIENNIIK